MRITRTVIRNFGPHAHYDVDTDAGIVGLIGDNGSGKSNFLAAVEVGLRGNAGDSSETLSSFIRTGSKSANVTLYLRKNGVEGSIERTITHTSSTRKLTWMGREYTKDSDVKRMLNEILGVDEYLLQNAVFIPQGQLDKLLFGTPTEREEMFIKIMLLGYMSKVSETADNKAHMLAKTVQDVTVLKDAFRAQHAEAELQLAAVESSAKRCPDVSKPLQQWQTIMQISHDITRHRAAGEQAHSKAIEKRTEIDRLKHAYASHHGIGGAAEKVAYSAQHVEETRKMVEAARADYAELAKYAGLRKAWDMYQADYDNSVQRLRLSSDALRAAKTDTTEDTIKLIEARIADLKETKTRFDALETTKLQLATLRAESVELEADVKESEAKANKLKDSLQALEQEGRDYKLKCDTLKAVMNCSTEISHCPLCEQQFTKTREQLQSMLDVAEANREAKAKAWREEQSAYAVIFNEANTKKATLMRNEGNIKSLEEGCASLEKILSARSPIYVEHISNAQKEMESRMKELRDYQQCSRDYDSVLAQVRDAEAKLDAISEEDKAKAADATEDKLTKAKEELELKETKLKEFESLHSMIAEAELAFKMLMEESANHSKAEAALRTKLSAEELPAITQNIISSVTAEVPDCETDKDKLRSLVLVELRNRQNEHEQTKGLLEATRKQANDAAERLRELEKREELNAETLKVVEELKQIKEAFSRKGIPRSYINYYYDKLLSQAQNTLEAMNANFSVIPHPTKPVSLQFFRNDKKDGTIYDQTKLSGGQKVRVTMSFLLAVQRLLVTDLGFMCLDEPSMHIDEEGKEAMRDMFVRLGDQMSNGDSQIWISDHSDVIATAYEKVIKLK